MPSVSNHIAHQKAFSLALCQTHSCWLHKLQLSQNVGDDVDVDVDDDADDDYAAAADYDAAATTATTAATTTAFTTTSVICTLQGVTTKPRV